MSAFKGTPGPWVAGPNINGSEFVYALNIDGVNRFFAGIQPGWVSRGVRASHDEMSANAILIASAPDLLDAVTNLLQDTQHANHICGDGPHCPVVKARAAIAKALGEQP